MALQMNPLQYFRCFDYYLENVLVHMTKNFLHTIMFKRKYILSFQYFHLFVDSLPEDCQDIDSTDWWSEKACDSLDIVEQLSEVLNDWDPENCYCYQHHYTYSEMKYYGTGKNGTTELILRHMHLSQ